jgi:hypothetical protein
MQRRTAGETQQGVAESLSWATGEVSFMSGDSAALRRLSEGSSMPQECLSLINLLITTAVGLGVAFAFQYMLVLLWRHHVNRRYYRALRRKVDVQWVGGVAVKAKRRRLPRFFPFPKSLVWPTPLFFTSCIFLTGLTRASVRLLASWPSGTGAGCIIAAILCLLASGSFVIYALVDTIRFRRQHAALLKWKPNKYAATWKDVKDPWMALTGRARVESVSTALLAKDRARSVTVSTATAARRVTGMSSRRLVVAPMMTGSSSTLHGDPPALPARYEPADGPIEAVGGGEAAKLPGGAGGSGGRRVRIDPEADAAEGAGGAAAGKLSPHPRKPPVCLSTSGRVKSFKQARTLTQQKFMEKGLPDRKSGAFGGAPAADTKEPARTERLLGRPFQFRKSVLGDSIEAKAGFLMFRVNGASAIGANYRLIVLCGNMTFGVLSGLSPLLPTGSGGAFVQGGIVMLLQFGMAFLCCRYLPDADRIISVFMGTQFLFEGLSTLMNVLAAATGDGPDPSDPSGAYRLNPDFLVAGLWVAVFAVAVPMLQLLEQRIVTPCVGIVRTGGCDRVALVAALYIFVTGLPRRIQKIGLLIAGLDDADDDDDDDDGGGDDGEGGDDDGGGDDAQQTTTGASASMDAGDDAGDGGDGSGAAEGVALDATDAAEAAAKVAKLAARGVAAKEVQGKETDGGGD